MTDESACICPHNLPMTEDHHAINCPASNQYAAWQKMQASTDEPDKLAEAVERLLCGDGETETRGIDPVVTYADHSYRAYSRKQMFDFGMACAALRPAPAADVVGVSRELLAVQLPLKDANKVRCGEFAAVSSFDALAAIRAALARVDAGLGK